MDFKVEKFSYRLNALLEEHNMTQTQLAKMIGTSNVTICRYSTCKEFQDLMLLQRLQMYSMFLLIIYLEILKAKP